MKLKGPIVRQWAVKKTHAFYSYRSFYGSWCSGAGTAWGKGEQGQVLSQPVCSFPYMFTHMLLSVIRPLFHVLTLLSHDIKMTMRNISQPVYLCEVEIFRNVSYVFKQRKLTKTVHFMTIVDLILSLWYLLRNVFSNAVKIYTYLWL